MKRGCLLRRIVGSVRYWSPGNFRLVVFLFTLLSLYGLWSLVVLPLEVWSIQTRGAALLGEAQAVSASHAEGALREIQNNLLSVRRELETIPSWSERSLENRFRETISQTLGRTGGELLSLELKSKEGDPFRLEVRAASDYDTMLAVLDTIKTAGMPLSVDRHMVSFRDSVLDGRELLFLLTIEMQPFAAPESTCFP
jgi:hypothetical protein